MVAQASSGRIAAATFTDCIGNREVGCALAASGQTSVLTSTPSFVRASTDAPIEVTILVEGDATATFSVNVTEVPLTIVAAGDACDPASNQQTCNPDVEGLACVTGPDAQTLFVCAVPVELAVGDGCVATDTAEVCGVDLACLASVCTVVPDRCESAQRLTSGLAVTGDTRTATNTYAFGTVAGNRCTGFPTLGPDLVYVIDVPAGQRLTAATTQTQSSYDLAMYVTTSCPFTAQAQCLVGADSGFSGGNEALTFTNTGGGDVYIVVDGFQASAAGTFTLTATVATIP